LGSLLCNTRLGRLAIWLQGGSFSAAFNQIFDFITQLLRCWLCWCW
jgi:hypothetical protein